MTRNVYTFLLYFLLPFTLLKLLWRARNQPEYLQHWRERYGFYAWPVTQPVIWLHCVSVGETMAAAPLVKALQIQYPGHQVLLTHTTPTGRAISEQLFGNDVQRVYLPYDVPFAVTRFLLHFKPVMGVLMETELWFNLIAGCQRQQIPLLLVNARLSERSARGYAKLGRLAHDGLKSLSAIAAQTEADAVRLQKLGASNVTVTGNLKFDVMPPADAVEQGQLLRNLLGRDRPVFLAASTRDGEEAILLDALVSAQVPNLLAVIVPRHPQRFDEVAELLKKRGCNFVRRSSLPHKYAEKQAQENDDADNKITVSQDASYVLGDSMGEMFTYYAACDVAFIGGSLLPFGGQNLIEACAMGKPVLIGPHTFNFKQATELAINAGAAQRVENGMDLALAVRTLFADTGRQQHMATAATRFSADNRGATLRVLALLRAHGLNQTHPH